jgi:GT2 family glycosyltransferase
MELSQSEIVAFTDDDCRVSPDWLERIAAVFVADSSVAVVCGRVQVPKEIRHLGWTESFQPRSRVWAGKFPPLGEWGITANLSLRRAIVARVGPFDPFLGAGSPLLSGGEPDFLFRVLSAGLKVVNAEEVLVNHVGLRKLGDETRKLVRGYGVGTGAAFFKHVRLGDSAAAGIYLQFVVTLSRQVSANVITGKRPTGAGFLLAFLCGPLASLRFDIDRGTRQYRER